MNISFFDAYRPHLEAMADIAGQIALKYFRSSLAINVKSDLSPVTEADQVIETKLRNYIQENFPSHGLIGEEYGTFNEGADFIWVIDPIDGTRAFMTGKPLFGTIIGLLHNGKPILGLLDQPFIKERWIGSHEEKALYNDEPIRVAEPRSLAKARLYAGSPNMFLGPNFERYLRLVTEAKWPQYGCDCYAYGLVAMGMADCVIEQRLKIYDVAGLIPIITGAGGQATDWHNKEITLPFTSGEFLGSSHEALHHEILTIMNGDHFNKGLNII